MNNYLLKVARNVVIVVAIVLLCNTFTYNPIGWMVQMQEARKYDINKSLPLGSSELYVERYFKNQGLQYHSESEDFLLHSPNPAHNGVALWADISGFPIPFAVNQTQQISCEFENGKLTYRKIELISNGL